MQTVINLNSYTITALGKLNETAKSHIYLKRSIVEQLCDMRNELTVDLREIEPGLRDAIDKFAKIVSITNEDYDNGEIVGGYIRYVLHEGTVFEKTRLIRNIDVELTLHERKIFKAA
jgi:hypothetical protein